MIELNKIYNEDCLETMKRMPDNFVDLIVTDPPYGLSFNNGDLAHNWEAVFGGDKNKMKARPIANDKDEKEADELFCAMLKEAARVLKKKGGCCCCCTGGGPKPSFARWVLYMDEILQFNQAVVWDKGGLGMGLHYRRNYEFMLIAHRKNGSVKWNGGNSQPNIVRINKIIPREDQHPTEKPVELMAKFILLHSDKNDIIYDPFMGHGSTGIATYRHARNFIGSEIDKKHFAVAQKRIDAERNQMKLF